MIENWIHVRGYENHYLVSDLGNIKSLKYKTEKIIKQTVSKKDGYCRVTLYGNKKRKTFLVHRLVASAFLINKENKKEVNHKDFDKTNNKLENLEWCTSSENSIHKYKYKNCHMVTGENHHKSKLSKNDVYTICFLFKYTNIKFREIARMYNVSHISILHIKDGKNWKQLKLFL